MLESELASRLRGAFPSAIAADVDAALAVVPNSRRTPSNDDIGPVLVAGEALHIPRRFYSPEPPAEALDSLGASARTVLACLYTRHNDGHVRERHLRYVISSTAHWVPPFVVQLLGEYVLEVHRVIVSNVNHLDQPSYVRFVAENPTFMQLTRQRVVSYWDCYFRSAAPKLQSHEAFRVLAGLESGQVRSQAGGLAS